MMLTLQNRHHIDRKARARGDPSSLAVCQRSASASGWKWPMRPGERHHGGGTKPVSHHHHRPKRPSGGLRPQLFCTNNNRKFAQFPLSPQPKRFSFFSRKRGGLRLRFFCCRHAYTFYEAVIFVLLGCSYTFYEAVGFFLLGGVFVFLVRFLADARGEAKGVGPVDDRYAQKRAQTYASNQWIDRKQHKPCGPRTRWSRQGAYDSTAGA